MKKTLLFLFAIASATASMACTNFIVAKGASTDGSVICTYNADDYGMFQSLCHFPAGKHAKGEMRKVYDWDTNVYHGEIAEAPETYNVIGNINEWQVTIGETTFGGREELVDPKGILDYGSLIYIALQRSKTAREAINVGKGPENKGAVWVAMRIPDNAICAHANQSRITKFNLKDKKNVLYAKDVITFAREKGFFTGKDADFSFNAAYAAPDFSGRRYCEARVWSFFNHFGDMMPYLDYAVGKVPNAEPMPLWIVPNHKVSVQEVEACMRDHYEGTPFSLDQDMGGGIWEMPYRPTPLSFEVDGKKCFNERPTSTQQTGFSYVSQMRSWLPREIGGCLWWGNDDGNMVAYTPIYCCNTVQPKCYNTPGADAVTFSMDNAFWVCNWVSNMVYPRYSQMFPSLKEVRDSLENSYFANQKSIEDRAIQLYGESPASAQKFLNDYSNEKAQQMLDRWKQLAFYLIVKYNDMAVKPEKDGKFELTPEGLGAKVKRPGFPVNYARRLIKETGDKLIQP